MRNIDELINFLSSFPSIGRRSATKIAIEMCENKDRMMLEFGKRLQDLSEIVSKCENCNNIDIQNPCKICNDKNNRDRSRICLIDSVSDLWNIEKTNFYHGLYFIINSSIIGSRDFEIHFAKMLETIKRINEETSLKEVIIANNTNLQGQTFLFYINDVLENLKNSENISFEVTTLSKGMPSGSSIEYLDEKTLLTAIKDRRVI